MPGCTDARTCPLRENCPYARLFELVASGRGPSGLPDPPRPFVFRAAHLDRRTLQPAEAFHFDVHIFDLQDPPLAYFVLSVAQLAHEGLGPARGRAELERVEQLGADREPQVEVFDGRTFLIQGALPPLELDLRPRREPARRVRVRLVTPMELKGRGELALPPECWVLFGRTCDRLSTLRALYGGGSLHVDFKAMGERAGRVRLVRSALRWTETTRRSGKSGQFRPSGGFTGEVEHEGDLAGFLPYLEAAQRTGVGRQTVLGKGRFG